MSYVSADEIFDFATNTGSMYGAHKKLAREHATDVPLWASHLTANILPLFKRELHLRTISVRSHELTDAAKRLRDYYVDHVKGL